MLDALQGLQRHRRRSPAEPAGDVAGAQRLHAGRTRRSTRRGCWSTSTPGASGWPPTAASSRRNIGLDGKIGGAAGGKWYGGVYGWGFTVEDAARPDKLAHRNQHFRASDRLHERLPADRRRPLPRRLAQADRRRQRARRRSSTARRCTRTCTATRAGTHFTPQRYSHGRARDLVPVDEATPTAHRLPQTRLAGVPGRQGPGSTRRQALRRDLEQVREARRGDARRTQRRRTRGWRTIRWRTTRRASSR